MSKRAQLNKSQIINKWSSIRLAYHKNNYIDSDARKLIEKGIQICRFISSDTKTQALIVERLQIYSKKLNEFIFQFT